LLAALAVAALAIALPCGAQYYAEFEITPEALEPLSPAMYREIAGLHYLLNPYQLRQFFALPSDEHRQEWIAHWWRSQDPTPTTPQNEMRIQHYKRVRTARLEFGWEGWPGWDHRGETLIRFGAPEFRRGLDWIVTPRGVVPPGESWHYSRLEMTVIFEDFNLSGRYTFAMNSWGNLDPTRTSRVGKPIDADFDPPRWGMPPPPTNWWYVYLSEEAQEKVNNFQAVEEKHTATYPFNFSRKELPFVFEIDQFKGGDSINRVEVNVEFPAVMDPALPEDENREYAMTAVIFDTQYNEISRERTLIGLPADVWSESSSRWIPAQLVFSLPPQYYRMAVTVEDLAGRSSSYRSVVATSSYHYDMAISDVVFCSKIVPAAQNSPFNRGALQVVPHPLRQYAVSESVPMYFELYNLDLDEDGLSSYLVEYWVIPKTPRKWGLWYMREDQEIYAASRFESSAYGSDVPLNISIDTDNLWPGEFEFHVKVTDTRTLFTTDRTATFHLVE
jgi:GWxTD domain-containing protein